jgi:hypothetical protein
MALKYAGLALLACAVVYCLSSPRALGEEDVDAGSYGLRLARARAIYLCDWRESHTPKPNPSPMDVCSDPKLPIGKVITQWDHYWAWWNSYDAGLDATSFSALRASFETAWNGFGGQTFRADEAEHKRTEDAAGDERVRLLHEKRAAEELAAEQAHEDSVRREQESAARVAAKKKKDFEASASTLSNDDLCVAFSIHHYGAARAELETRSAFDAGTWALINEKKIAVGMSEAALLCSWGRGRHVNRIVTLGHVSKQYVYRSALVYVDNGTVTGFQDSQ